MQLNIQPLYPVSTINCACGNVVETRTTRGSFSTDVCAACHPFYTGKQKIMDTAGRVDRFRKRYATTSPKGSAAAAPAAAAPADEK
ncbi:MAG: 50S ribosomal protein L31 [Deltaproteobacteria bacterium]|nr:50S ribosomal protein L31 [Deltaproteobacteria bacterium]MBK8696617.1 50S ribosomal protein L31 [Deltaproteobacteria bacterium]MBP6834230.1 50S ribosomal protein L31 [Deltaproteobacteria bacterium]